MGAQEHRPLLKIYFKNPRWLTTDALKTWRSRSYTARDIAIFAYFLVKCSLKVTGRSKIQKSTWV